MALLRREALYLAGGFFIGLLFTYSLTNNFTVTVWKDGELAREVHVASDTSEESLSSAPSQPQRQRQFPSFFEDPCREIPLPSPSEFFRYLNTVTIPCRKKIMFGGVKRSKGLDGDKFVCMDPPYELAGPDCNVLSFGINNEWSFDDAMDRLGCKVYAFDPTMGKPSHDRSPNIKFFNIGVYGKDGTIKINNKNAEVLTYKSITKLTSTEDKIIHYLKIDVEGSEVSLFDEAFSTSSHLLQRINQIGMEIHGPGVTASKRMKEYWRQFQKFECLGFRLMHMNPNRPNQFVKNGTTYSCCYELVWVMGAPKDYSL